jgi:hypothetical protein
MQYFLYGHHKTDSKEAILDQFSMLDDSDIAVSVKLWTQHEDITLANLCKSMINRKLFKIELQNEPFQSEKINSIKEKTRKSYSLNDHEASYFVFSDYITNKAYSSHDDKIQILYKNKEIKDITEASDMLNLSVLSKIVKKYFLCYPKENGI